MPSLSEQFAARVDAYHAAIEEGSPSEQDAAYGAMAAFALLHNPKAILAALRGMEATVQERDSTTKEDRIQGIERFEAAVTDWRAATSQRAED